MTTSPYTFEDLSTPEGADTIRARLMASLLADGQPTGSWAPSEIGGTENLRADMVAGGLAFYMAERIAAFVNGRMLPLASDSPENGYFLTYLGKRFYKLQKRVATYTVQNILLRSTAAAAAQSFSDGDLWVASPTTGNKYRLTLPVGETVDITPSGSVNAPFRAENPGASYLDPAQTVTTMVTAKAGISCTNFKPYDFAPTRSTGSSSGTVTGIWVLGPVFSMVRVRIDASGDIGGGQHSVSLDGGLTWQPRGPIVEAENLTGSLGLLKYANGGVSPSFVAGSIFSLALADNFLQRGADAETDAAFRARCSNRHPARASVVLRAHIDLWAHEASPEVDKVTSEADPNTPGGILVTIASATGPATPAAQAAVEDFIVARLNGYKGVPAPVSPTVPGSRTPEETALVASAIRFEIRAAATVYMSRALIPAAKAAVDQDWAEYLASLPLGGKRNALVELQRFYDILGELGADDVQDLVLNEVASDLTVPKAQCAVVAAAWVLADHISWVPI